MKFTLTEKIEKQTKIPYNKIIIIFMEGTYESFQRFPDGIMDGLVVDGKIKTVINLPRFILPRYSITKSRVNGSVKPENRHTNIHLKISPSWLEIGLTSIWLGLLLLTSLLLLFNLDNQNLLEALRFFGFIIILALIPLVLSKIKVYRDRLRLENWLDIKISNIA